MRVCEFAGLERWNGLLEWTTGLDYWRGGATFTHAHAAGYELCSQIVVNWLL